MKRHTQSTIPKDLRLVAWIQLLCGLCSVVTVAFQAAHNRYFLDFSVLGVPIYFGLMSKSNAWRTCTIVMLQLELVLLPCVFLVGLAGIPTGHVSAPVLALPIFLLVLWQYRVLMRAEIRALFQHPADAQGI
ncbi:MAG: hypothetical protein IPJ19_12085 [Planctomycetes bacterium]|nr:hypothetical protein [Planctomycetota bacterium]